MQALTLLSVTRTLQLGILHYTSGPDQQATHAKAETELKRVDECIASWRRALRKLSATTPKECTDEQLYASEPANERRLTYHASPQRLSNRFPQSADERPVAGSAVRYSVSLSTNS
jgi:hypothetical protein